MLRFRLGMTDVVSAPWRARKSRELWGIDPRSLAVFRIGLGVMLLSDLLKRSISFREHYTGEGVFPRGAAQVLEPDSPLFRLYLMSDAPAFQAALFVIAAALALCLIVGYRTRLVSVLSMWMLVSLVRRNPYCTHTGDVLLQAMTFWAMFLPLGSVFSLDRKQGRVPPPGGQVVSVATVSVLLQLVMFYFFAGLFKHRYDVWMRGDALWVFTNIEEYTRTFGLWLKDYPFACKLLTYFTLVLELGAPLLLFFPWKTGLVRTWTVIVLMGFHLGIQLTVYIGIFEILSIVAVCLFLPSWFWERLAAFLPRRWTGVRDAFGKRLLHVSQAPPPSTARSPRWSHLTWSLGQIACGAALLLMLFGNVNSARETPIKLPRWIEGYGKHLALVQNWNIFSSIEDTFYGWYLVVGQLDDGRIVDVLLDEEFEGVQRPEHFAKRFPNHNTRRFWRLMARKENEWLRPGLGRYLMAEWNRTHDSELRRMHAYHVGSVPGRGQDFQELRPLFHYPANPVDIATLPEDERPSFVAGVRVWRKLLTSLPKRIHDSNAEGLELVRTLERAMGGREAYDRARHLSWEFTGPRRHLWDKQTGDVRIETKDLLVLMNVETREGRVFEKGHEVEDRERLRELLDQGYRWWQNDSYWVVMPWKLQDPGVAVRHIGEERLPDGRDMDLLGVRFNGVGATPGNRYLLAIDRESGLLERWTFFRGRRDDKPTFTRRWSGWKSFGDLRLATDKRAASETQPHDWRLALAEVLVVDPYKDPLVSIAEALRKPGDVRRIEAGARD